jgi:ParB-like chromosome segregation protein Spo0J
VSDQLQLLPSCRPTVSSESLPLPELVGFEHARPSRELVDLIAELGVLQPIVVVSNGDGRYEIVEGRRRSKAVQLLAESDRWPKPAHIAALVLSGAGVDREEIRDGLTLALHGARSASPASELAAIEAILMGRGDDQLAITVKEIAAQTGISVQTVYRRLRLRRLSSTLRRAFDRGDITTTTAEEAAKLAPEQQDALERALLDGTRLTVQAVRDLVHQQRRRAGGELPSGLFVEREAAWRVTVLGHLRAALEALQSEERNGGLARAIANAYEHAKRA